MDLEFVPEGDRLMVTLNGSALDPTTVARLASALNSPAVRLALRQAVIRTPDTVQKAAEKGFDS